MFPLLTKGKRKSETFQFPEELFQVFFYEMMDVGSLQTFFSIFQKFPPSTEISYYVWLSSASKSISVVRSFWIREVLVYMWFQYLAAKLINTVYSPTTDMQLYESTPHLYNEVRNLWQANGTFLGNYLAQHIGGWQSLGRHSTLVPKWLPLMPTKHKGHKFIFFI